MFSAYRGNLDAKQAFPQPSAAEKPMPLQIVAPTSGGDKHSRPVARAPSVVATKVPPS
jgi:hypothetical protein